MALNESYWSQAVFTEDSRGHEFCYIPEGTVLFGRDRQEMEIKSPLYLARHPVTKADFHEFFVASGYDYDQNMLGLMDALAPYPDCPATPLSWDDAKAYVRWLREETGEYYSLPFEWEWEHAARGPDCFKHPWGNEEPNEERATFSTDMPVRQTTSVDAHPASASPYGCLDMVGNVWEWCLDTFDDDNQTHVLRGGSCMDSVECNNALAQRYVYPSWERMLYAGLRVTYLPAGMFLTYRLAMMGENATAEGTIVHP